MVREIKKILVMIVKNEMSNIEKIIQNVNNGKFDIVVITDTISTDGTDVALEKMGYVVYREKWVNFSHNRNNAVINGIKEIHKSCGIQYGPLTTAESDLIKKTDWFIFNIDADDLFEWKGELDPSVSIVRGRVDNGGHSFYKPFGFKWEPGINCVWRYQLHEMWLSELPSRNITWLSLNASCSGYRSSNPNKYLHDSHNISNLLASGIVTKSEKPRYYFYLARSQVDVGYLSSAVDNMLKVIDSDLDQDHKYIAMLTIRDIYSRSSNFDKSEKKVLQYTKKAYELSPFRPEAACHLFYHYYELKQYNQAVAIAAHSLKFYDPNNLRGHLFYVPYNWKFYANLSDSLYKIGFFNDFCEIVEIMISLPDFDDAARNIMKVNIDLMLKIKYKK